MIDRGHLLSDLKPQVRKLEDDLREQISEVFDVYERLKGEYDEAFGVGRTAATWNAWRDERVTQAAVAWVLGTVFVRFCEDTGLLPHPFIAGPTSERMAQAEEAQEEFFRVHPAETDRGWLLASFSAIQSSISSGQGGASLFSEQHNPLYQIPVSHDAAKALIAFWRRRDESGELVHNFEDPEWGTRFLGDLYQDLSESARKTYALLQTPEFVEEFILDRTLTPAIAEFGFQELKLIDPTCGSGHFLLGAFRRLVELWETEAPARDPYERVRNALLSVHGVDINSFAVAIARFRLLVAALKAAEIETLPEAVGYSFPIQIAVGDSLIKARQLSLFHDKRDELAEFAYATEDVHEFPGILQEGRYHVVVGNPPYITVRDPALNSHYRKLYDTCARQYALSVPFAQRIFELACKANTDGRGAGFAGQITSNSFMKREFGKKLIEDFFAHRVELTHVLNTSGAYIPGHGTPTVILIGRSNRNRRSETIRAVLGVRGEPGTPDDPDHGKVWQSIVSQIDNSGFENEWISVADLYRGALNQHPWSLSGGGASVLQGFIESSARTRLLNHVESIGFCAVTRQDDAYFLGKDALQRAGVSPHFINDVIEGVSVRDWRLTELVQALIPYHPVSLEANPDDTALRLLWPFRAPLRLRRALSGTQEDQGLTWYEYSSFSRRRYGSSNLISFAFVATHNQFVLSRRSRVFIRTAPVIKLPEDADESEYLELLGLLNSSTACFWLKQVCHDKGSQGVNEGFKSQEWERFYEFTGTKLQEFPLPEQYPLGLARQLDTLAQRLTSLSPSSTAASATPTRERLATARAEWHATRAQMIALQEELDWQVYSLYGLLSEELTAPTDSVPELNLGERAFEIVLARQMAAGETETQWFARHNSTPITEIPAHWPEDYKAVVEARIKIIEDNRSLALIERPECKRRWATEGWDKLQSTALRDWLLDRCENRALWYETSEGSERPRMLTAFQLAQELRRDPDVVAVAELYAPGRDFNKVIAELVAEEHVPYLAALRYKDSGLSKRADWEHVWDLQRQEDAASSEALAAKIRETIPVPPKYASGDFRKTSFWRHRGKLDVPKERFVSYPDASRAGDPSLLLGWAGWDHQEQAQALADLIVERDETDGWDAAALTPLLAGLREVMPWVRQWHSDFDPSHGGSPAEAYGDFLAETTNRLNLTDETLAAWRPAKATRGRKKN